jgi:hypothetical protein
VATNKLNLTRDQLATFLKNHEQIKQFERLFADVSELEPTTLTDLSITASTAGQQAVLALDTALTTAQEAAVASASAESKAQVALEQIAALQADLGVGPGIADLRALLADLRTQVEGLQMTPPPVPKRRTRYGQFYDTTTQTAALTSTAYPITFNTTDISDGVRLRSPSTSEVEVDTEGLYNFQVSIQLDCTGGSNREVWVWVRKNGADIPNSAFYVTIQNNNSELLQAFNLFANMKAGDYVQFMWAVGNTDAQLATFAASAFAPAVPSIILTVSNNIRGES